MPEISERAKKYVSSPIRRIASLLEKASFEKQIISFGGGAPSLTPPKEIIEFLIEKLKTEPKKTLEYCSTEGLVKTRELISEDLKYNEGVDIQPDEIIITIGGTEALFDTFAAILNPGDEIITTDPCYLGYPEPIKLMGAVQKRIPISWEEDFQIDTEKLKEMINEKTKAFILISPDNPTGGVQKKETIKAIVEICEDKGIWLITDDIYKHIIFEGEFINSRKFGGYENTITCCSFSKSASIPGARIGYAYGPKEVIKKISNIKQATSLTPSKLSQMLVQKFLENKAEVREKYIKETVIPTYKKRRDVMHEELKKHGIPHSLPHGAFYFFPNFSEYLKDEEKFADALLKEKQVVVIPGKYFGPSGKEHLRLTFVSEPEERIKEGLQKMVDFLNSWKE